jgi:hypothetical protein
MFSFNYSRISRLIPLDSTKLRKHSDNFYRMKLYIHTKIWAQYDILLNFQARLKNKKKKKDG